MKRDLHADLALCEATPEWITEGSILAEYDRLTEMGCDLVATFVRNSDAEFAERAREGWPEALRRAIAAESEVEQLRDILGFIYQKARNDCAMWDGKMCVGLPVFQDRIYARRLVRDLGPILFPEVADDAAR